MKISTRNTFSGTIAKVAKGAVNAEVFVALPSDEQIVASITNGGVDSMPLKEGQPAIAVVTANWILLGKDLDPAKISARNVLSGTIANIHTGAVNAEVEVKLAAGTILTAIITNDSVQRLKLAVGEPISAAFKASSVIIATE